MPHRLRAALAAAALVTAAACTQTAAPPPAPAASVAAVTPSRFALPAGSGCAASLSLPRRHRQRPCDGSRRQGGPRPDHGRDRPCGLGLRRRARRRSSPDDRRHQGALRLSLSRPVAFAPPIGRGRSITNVEEQPLSAPVMVARRSIMPALDRCHGRRSMDQSIHPWGLPQFSNPAAEPSIGYLASPLFGAWMRGRFALRAGLRGHQGKRLTYPSVTAA